MPLHKRILNYVNNKMLTLKQAKNLSFTQRRTLETEIIGYLIQQSVLSMSQALMLKGILREYLNSPYIHKLLIHKKILISDLFTLEADQLYVLNIPNIHQLIIGDIISFRQALSIPFQKIYNFESRSINSLLYHQIISFEKLLALNIDQVSNLRSYTICELIQAKIITYEFAIQLNQKDFGKLQNHSLLPYLSSKLLSVENILALESHQLANLSILGTFDLIAKRYFNLNDVLQISVNCATILPLSEIKNLLSLDKEYSLLDHNCSSSTQWQINYFCFLQKTLKTGQLSLQRLISLNYNILYRLNSKHLNELISKSIIPMEQVLGLSTPLISHLDSLELSKNIQDGYVSLNEVLQLNNQRIYPSNLNSKELQKLISNKDLTIIEGLLLTPFQISILEFNLVQFMLQENLFSLTDLLSLEKDSLEAIGYSAIAELILERHLHLDQLKSITQNQIQNLINSNILGLFRDEHLTLDQILNLSHEQNTIYSSDEICELISLGKLTIQQVSLISRPVLGIIQSPQVYSELLTNKLTIGQLLLGQSHHHASINNTQSTHNIAVNTSSAKCAKNLHKRYGTILKKQSLDTIFNKIKFFLKSDEDNSSLEQKSAIACILRSTQKNYTYCDPISKVSFKHMLALSFFAFTDNQLLLCSAKDAKQQFISALYEIQRGYNLDENGVDNLDPLDKPICPGGSFNKLSEKLKGFHPDANLKYMTKLTAGFKLLRVIQEEASSLLFKFSFPKNIKDLFTFIHLINKVKQHGVESLFYSIKNRIRQRMFIEFEPLYRRQDNPEFIKLIEVGSYASLENTEKYKKNLLDSQAYHQYCSMTLQFNSSSRPSLLYLKSNENHADSKKQPCKRG